ncbi:hypothetical protein P8452_15864 [Trifolium repens]|nr:hypothetical protein P8452_15864 [Trifolium repens]
MCPMLVLRKQGGDNEVPEISKREKARLREMQKMKKQKVQEILDAQNAAIEADMNNRGKGRLNRLSCLRILQRSIIISK